MVGQSKKFEEVHFWNSIVSVFVCGGGGGGIY